MCATQETGRWGPLWLRNTLLHLTGIFLYRRQLSGDQRQVIYFPRLLSPWDFNPAAVLLVLSKPFSVASCSPHWPCGPDDVASRFQILWFRVCASTPHSTKFLKAFISTFFTCVFFPLLVPLSPTTWAQSRLALPAIGQGQQGRNRFPASTRGCSLHNLFPDYKSSILIPVLRSF